LFAIALALRLPNTPPLLKQGLCSVFTMNDSAPLLLAKAAPGGLVSTPARLNQAHLHHKESQQNTLHPAYINIHIFLL
jgi:hypothetical protein